MMMLIDVSFLCHQLSWDTLSTKRNVDECEVVSHYTLTITLYDRPNTYTHYLPT